MFYDSARPGYALRWFYFSEPLEPECFHLAFRSLWKAPSKNLGPLFGVFMYSKACVRVSGSSTKHFLMAKFAKRKGQLLANYVHFFRSQYLFLIFQSSRLIDTSC